MHTGRDIDLGDPHISVVIPPDPVAVSLWSDSAHLVIDTKEHGIPDIFVPTYPYVIRSARGDIDLKIHPRSIIDDSLAPNTVIILDGVVAKVHVLTVGCWALKIIINIVSKFPTDIAAVLARTQTAIMLGLHDDHAVDFHKAGAETDLRRQQQQGED